MPGTFAALDQDLPRFTGEESLERRVQLLQDYQYQLLEQLRYILGHLDLRNFNQTALEKWTESLTDPIYRKISDAEGNITQLEVTAQGILSRVSDSEGNISQLQQTAREFSVQIADNAGNISQLRQTATELSSQIRDTNGNISQLQQTAAGIMSTVSNQAGQISQLWQTAAGIQTTVSDQAGQISILQQRADGFQTIVAGQNENISEIRQSVDSITFSVNGSSLELTKDGVTVSHTLQAAKLAGNSIELLDDWGRVAAAFELTGASSTADRKLAVWSGALQLSTWAGDVYISAGSGGALQVGDSEVQITGDLIPNRADRYSCGTYGFPWSDVYSTDGTISSSDRRGKKDIDYGMGRYSGLFDRLRPCSFLRTGGTSGRRHHGLIAQEVREALEAEGMTGIDFAGYAEWDGGCGLRYEEVIAMLIYEVQKLKKGGDHLERNFGEAGEGGRDAVGGKGQR